MSTRPENSTTTSRAPSPVAPQSPSNGSETIQGSEFGGENAELVLLFRKLWLNATDDNRLTLFGFRRYRTIHLLNLRFLEYEIDKIDRKIYQAGLKLGCQPTGTDRLGLRHSRKDPDSEKAEDVLNETLILELRQLIHEYDTALTSFNNVMRMETFSLADNNWLSSLRGDLNAYEVYKTRLVRVDLPPQRGTRDLLQHKIRKCLRAFWFYVRCGGIEKVHQPGAQSSSVGDVEANLKKSYQNTALIAEIITRLLIALLGGVFLVVPLVILSMQQSDKAHLITVSICIVAFSFLISILTKASNQEIMGASAAYAAVLTVFVSNSPTISPVAHAAA